MHQAPLPVPLATVAVDLATAPVPTTTPRAVPRTALRTGPRHAHWYCPHQQATLATGDEFFVRDGRLPTPVTVVAVAVPTREPAMTVAVATKAVISLRIFPPCSARWIYSTRDRIGCSWRQLRPGALSLHNPPHLARLRAASAGFTPLSQSKG